MTTSTTSAAQNGAGIDVLFWPDELDPTAPPGADGGAGAAGLRAAPPQDDLETQLALNQYVALIGWGGTGKEILTQVKARFCESHGGVPDHVSLLSFDSADEVVTAYDHRNSAVVTLENGREFFRLEQVPLAGIKRNPERHPEIVERLGLDVLNRINRAAIIDGAAQQRVQGLLVYLWNAGFIERTVMQCLRQLLGRGEGFDSALRTNATIKVFIVASMAGGQGAGALIDAAYVVDEKLAELGTLGDSRTIIGALLLPGAFREHEGQQMRANARSLVEEVNALMLGKQRFTAAYPGSEPVDSVEPPFDYALIFDGIDENGRNWPSQGAVCGLAAQTLWLLASSAVGMHQINSMLNKLDVLTGHSEAGYGSYLGTAGQATIRFPRHEVVERCSVRHSQAMIAALTAPRDPQQTLPLSPWSAAGALSALRRQVQTGEDGAPITVTMTAPAALDQLPVEEMPLRARGYVDSFFRLRISEKYFAQMKSQAATLARQHAHELGAQLNSLLTAGRFDAARHWLGANIVALEAQVRTLAQEQARLGDEVQQQQQHLQSAAEALERAPEGIIPFLRRGAVRSALSTYLAEANTLARSLLEQRATDLAAELVRQQLAWLQTQARTLDLLIARLHQAHEWLTTHEAALAGRSEGGVERSLARPALIDYFYGRYAGAAAADAQLAIAQGSGVARWAQQSPEQIARHLMQSAAATFAPILQCTVEDVLQLLWGERSAEQWVERLKAWAAAAWNIDRSLLKSGGAALASFFTIGVPDAAASIFAGCGHTLVSTRDVERIIVLRTVYGASFDALKPFVLWQRAYERLASHRPLHVLRDFHRRDDRSEQIFALGLVFDSIYQDHTWYYHRPADPLRQPIRLGNGRANALAAFHQRSDLQRDVMSRIEAQITADGVSQAAARIEAWVNEGGAGDDEMLNRLRVAARAYLQQLRGL